MSAPKPRNIAVAKLKLRSPKSMETFVDTGAIHWFAAIEGVHGIFWNDTNSIKIPDKFRFGDSIHKSRNVIQISLRNPDVNGSSLIAILYQLMFYYVLELDLLHMEGLIVNIWSCFLDLKIAKFLWIFHKVI